MNLAYPGQKFQDWFTQQWVLLWGRKIDPKEEDWLMGPFGEFGVIGDNFIVQLAKKEELIIERNRTSYGLITPIDRLNLSNSELCKLSKKVIDFYENTSDYDLELSVKWNPFFKIFGSLVNILFSNRINQLNIPMHNADISNEINSEIITLSNPANGKIKYTIWFRTNKITGKVIYSGVYSTCRIPSGKICVKAVFPLPKGNATVILSPKVDEHGGLTLVSSGEKFGDAGFYFLVNDTKGFIWSHYIKFFREQLYIFPKADEICAEQTLTLWNKRVLRFNYRIEFKKI